MISGIFIPFFSTLVAEFLDKSQLAVLLLSTRSSKNLQLFLGSFLAFLLVDGLAIIFGGFITRIIPLSYLTYLSGFLFILFGILALVKKDDEDTTTLHPTRNIFLQSFLIISVSEWGDKTQLASAVFATQYPLPAVFIGVLAALSLLSLLAITFGKTITKFFPKHIVTKISGTVFILIGLFFLVT